MEEESPLPQLIIADGGIGQMEVIREVVEGRPVIGHKTVLDQNPFHSTPFSAKKLSYRNSPQGTQGQSQDREQNVREDHAHAPGPLP